MSSLKSPRHRARAFAIQGLYQWQLGQTDILQVEYTLRDTPHFNLADVLFFRTVLYGVVEVSDALKTHIMPHLKQRNLEEISPIERAVLLLATYELCYTPETPLAVIMNEAIELTKTFGGTDGHKFVNGVLDKIAQLLRQSEWLLLQQQKSTR